MYTSVASGKAAQAAVIDAHHSRVSDGMKDWRRELSPR
jgi:hypothetical protein